MPNMTYIQHKRKTYEVKMQVMIFTRLENYFILCKLGVIGLTLVDICTDK